MDTETVTLGSDTSRRRLLRVAGAGAALAAAAPLARPWVARAARRYSIAMVPKALDILVFSYGHYGAEQRAKELGDVDVIWTGPTVQDANKQAQIIQGLISRHVDGIAVTAAAAQPLIGPVNAAVDAGIVVTAWDSDVPGSKRALFYGVDAYQMGLKLAEQTLKLIGNSGLVVLESGGPGATDQNTRLKAVMDTFKKYPDIRTVGPFFHNDDLLKAQELTDNLLLAHPDAAALLMAAGTPMFGKMSGMPGLIKNAGKIKVVATDNAPTQMPFVKEGYVQALVGQDYWGWGYQTISIIHNLLTVKGCKYPAFVPQDIPVITAANVDEWIDRWAKATSTEGAASVFKEEPIGCSA
jgi:ribose transport system substrate-binding protein